MAKVQEVIGEGAPNTARVGQTRQQLTNELAAVSLQLLDLREARTEANKSFNRDIKKLEKRNRELAQTVKAAGFRDQFQTEFGSIVAGADPGDDDDDEGEEIEH